MTLRCYCGNWAIHRTAWTSTNAGRRFAVCSSRSCNYFLWLDPPLCYRGRQVEKVFGESSNGRCVQDCGRCVRDFGRCVRDVVEEKKESGKCVVVEEKKPSCSLALFLLILTWICIAFLYLVATIDE